MSVIIASVIFVLVIILDQLTKYLVVANMTIGQSIDVIPGVFRFTYIRNAGAAFGMLDSERWIFLTLTAVALVFVGYLIIKYRKKLSKLYIVSLSLILGGGFSNMIDRCFFGESFLNGTVIDFLDFCAFPKIWYFIFNVADACVCVGAGIFVVAYIVSEVKAAKAKKAAAEISENTSDGNEN